MFFLRQYIKGIKNSGTKDIWSGDFIPTEKEVVEAFGGENGKYVLFERGAGIRGMRKVTEFGPYSSSLESSLGGNRLLDSQPSKKEWLPKMFAAESKSINVKQEIALEDLPDGDLDELWGSMLGTPVESEEDFDKFSADTQKIRQEINRRLTERSSLLEGLESDVGNSEGRMVENEAETHSYLEGLSKVMDEKSGHSTLAVVVAGVTGLVVGGVAQEVRWSKKMTDAEERIARLETQLGALAEAEERRAENVGSDMLSTSNILQRFNSSQGL